jgi:hypothetical protein
LGVNVIVSVTVIVGETVSVSVSVTVCDIVWVEVAVKGACVTDGEFVEVTVAVKAACSVSVVVALFCGVIFKSGADGAFLTHPAA